MTDHEPSKPPRRDFFSRYSRWPANLELSLLLMVLVIGGGAWGFIKLAEEVREGETQNLDEALLLAMRNPADLHDPIGPKWLEELGRDFTALGGMGVLTALTLAVIGYLLLVKKHRTALLVAAAVGGGMILSLLLKYGFDRPRPDLVPHESYVYTTSFPSGHSMMAAITYLTLAALLARVENQRRVKLYFIALAALLTIAVGISRVYMGVHWPSDVLAGWTAGATWALACWQLGRWLQRRGKIEQAGSEPELK
ncbi:phosphatase PAP2 family protein [Motiliproteus sp. SC1-56]|uniref:phosphatase PAP2 family protein n=1 Tax=Motiliproteus sp. SC1-56 TaxID=2799565 RepID=UPI001A8F4A71|nr:phosphatase PAP2 family protein [Motiliproteus sp. SC1-56]